MSSSPAPATSRRPDARRPAAAPPAPRRPDGRRRRQQHAACPRAVAAGIVANVRGFMLYGDYRQPNPPAAIVRAVAAGDIDVGSRLGAARRLFRRALAGAAAAPAGHAGRQRAGRWSYISVGVQRGHQMLLNEVDRVLARRHGEIEAARRLPRAGRRGAVTPKQNRRPKSLRTPVSCRSGFRSEVVADAQLDLPDGRRDVHAIVGVVRSHARRVRSDWRRIGDNVAALRIDAAEFRRSAGTRRSHADAARSICLFSMFRKLLNIDVGRELVLKSERMPEQAAPGPGSSCENLQSRSLYQSFCRCSAGCYGQCTSSRTSTSSRSRPAYSPPSCSTSARCSGLRPRRQIDKAAVRAAALVGVQYARAGEGQAVRSARAADIGPAERGREVAEIFSLKLPEKVMLWRLS